MEGSEERAKGNVDKDIQKAKKEKKAKHSRYTPWWRFGGEEL
jgi:hypothetical protein